MAKIFVSFNIVTTDDIIVVVRTNGNPNTEVWRSPVYHPPHSQRNFTVDPVEPVMHKVQVWSTTDGVTLDALKGQMEVDATVSSEQSFQMLSFVVDRGNVGAPSYDPASSQEFYYNPDLDGKEYVVFKPGYGPLTFGYQIQKIPGGGFKFIDGQAFSNGEEYTLMISNITQVQQLSAGQSYPSGVIDVPGALLFTSSHHNKLLEVTAAASIQITVADFNAIPNNTQIGINTHAFTGLYVTLQLPATFFCKIRNRQRNAVYIGRGESVTFIKKDSSLRVVSWDGDVYNVGKRITADGAIPLNCLRGWTGGWVLQSDYKRIYEWYVAELGSADYFAGTDDVLPQFADRARWGIGATKFWVPNKANLFNRITDGTRASGNYQAQDVGPHTHPVKPPDANSTAGFGKTSTGNDSSEGSGITQYSTGQNAGQETRPENVAVYEYIII